MRGRVRIDLCLSHGPLPRLEHIFCCPCCTEFSPIRCTLLLVDQLAVGARPVYWEARFRLLSPSLVACGPSTDVYWRLVAVSGTMTVSTFHFCFSLVILQLLKQAVPVQCGMVERHLINQLLENYNPLERPVLKESDRLNVNFSVTLQQIIDVDEKNQILISNLWLNIVSACCVIKKCLI